MSELSGPLTRVEIAPIPLAIIALLPLICALLIAVSGGEGAGASKSAKGAKTKGDAAAASGNAVFIAALGLVLSAGASLYQFWILTRLPQATHSLYSYQWTLLRVGSLDVNLAFVFDRLSGALVLAVTLLGLLAAFTLQPVSPSEPARARARLLIGALVIVGGADFMLLADNLVLMVFGWELSAIGAYFVVTSGQSLAAAPFGIRLFLLNRVGDWFLLGAIGLTVWGLGGGWPTGDFAADNRARFAAVTQAPPGQKVSPPASPELRDMRALVGQKSVVTFSSYPGAKVYLGMDDETQLPAAQAIGTSPFRQVPIDSGAHMVAIIPGQGATVGGDGNEGALLENVWFSANEEKVIIPIGQTATFREITDQLHLRDEDDALFMQEALKSRRVLGITLADLISLFVFLGIAVKTSLLPFGGRLPTASRETTSGAGLVIGAAVALPAIYLLARLEALLRLSEGTSSLLMVLGTVTALFAGLMTMHREPAASSRPVVQSAILAHLAVAIAGVGSGAKFASVHLVLATVVLGALLLATDGAEPRLWIPRAKFRFFVALAMVGVIPSLAMHDVVGAIMTGPRAGALGAAMGVMVLVALVLTSFGLMRAILLEKDATAVGTKRKKSTATAASSGASAICAIAVVALCVAASPVEVHMRGIDIDVVSRIDAWLSPQWSIDPSEVVTRRSTIGALIPFLCIGAAVLGLLSARRKSPSADVSHPLVRRLDPVRMEAFLFWLPRQLAAVLRHLGRQIEWFVTSIPTDIVGAIGAATVSRVAQGQSSRLRILTLAIVAIAIGLCVAGAMLGAAS